MVDAIRVTVRRGGVVEAVHRVHVATTDGESWGDPQLTFLEPAVWSSGRKAAMLAMRGYLVVSVVLLIVKAVQLGSA